MLRITRLYAFTSIDDDDVEGVIAAMMPDGMMMPLVGADLTMVDKLRSTADMIAQITGRPYKIKIFQLID